MHCYAHCNLLCLQGGFAVAYLGASACFLVDAATFLVAAACAWQLVAAAADGQGCVAPVLHLPRLHAVM